MLLTVTEMNRCPTTTAEDGSRTPVFGVSRGTGASVVGLPLRPWTVVIAISGRSRLRRQGNLSAPDGAMTC
jgi:hypothetical protein